MTQTSTNGTQAPVRTPVFALELAKKYAHLDLKTPEMRNGKVINFIVMAFGQDGKIYQTRSRDGQTASLMNSGSTKWYIVDAAHAYEQVAGVSDVMIFEWHKELNGGQYLPSAGEGTDDAMGVLPNGTGLRHRYPDKEGRSPIAGVSEFNALATAAKDAASYAKKNEGKLANDQFHGIAANFFSGCKAVGITRQQMTSAIRQNFPELFAPTEKSAQ